MKQNRKDKEHNLYSSSKKIDNSNENSNPQKSSGGAILLRKK